MIPGPLRTLPGPWKYWINASMLSATANKQTANKKLQLITI